MDIRDLTAQGLRDGLASTREAVNPIRVRLQDAEMREDLARQESASLRLALSHLKRLEEMYETEAARRAAEEEEEAKS